MTDNASAAAATASKSSPLDRPIPKPIEVNESLFALFFAEAVRHSFQRVENVSDLETKLCALGLQVGWRALELVGSREKVEKRELRIVQALQHVTGTCWTALFGKTTDGLERSTSAANTYFISEKEPLPWIIKGLLTAQGFDCEVTAHWQEDKSGATKVVYLVAFDQGVTERENRLAKNG